MLIVQAWGLRGDLHAVGAVRWGGEDRLVALARQDPPAQGYRRVQRGEAPEGVLGARGVTESGELQAAGLVPHGKPEVEEEEAAFQRVRGHQPQRRGLGHPATHRSTYRGRRGSLRAGCRSTLQ